MLGVSSSCEPTFSHRMAQTTIKICLDTRERKIQMNPGDSLKKIIDHARTEFSIPDDLAICLRRAQGRSLLDNLDQSVESSGLKGQSIIVEYSEEAKKELTARRQRDEAIAHKVQCAEHQKWRRVASPEDVTRYDLLQHAQVLETVATGANAEQMEQLWTTLGMRKIDFLVFNVLKDPSWASETKRNAIMDQMRAVPFQSVAAPPSTPPRSTVASNIVTPPSVSPATGPSTIITRDLEKKSPAVEIGPVTPPPNDPPAAGGGGAAAELTTQTLGFGEIIQPRMKRDDMVLPNIGPGVQISGFERVSLKWHKKEGKVSEEVDWHKKVLLDVYDCWVSCDKDRKPQICYFEVGRESKSPKIIKLEWLKKESSQSRSPVPAVSGAAAAAAAAGADNVPISEVLKVPEEISSRSSFSMMLKLESGDLLMQFRGDADMKKFERAIKHVYQQCTFSGQGHKLDASVLTEDKRKYVIAYGTPDSAHLPEGLVFRREQCFSDERASLVPEDSDFRTSLNDFLQLKELNTFHEKRATSMAALKKKLATLEKPEEIARTSSELEKLGVMNLEVFKLTEQKRRLEEWLEENIWSPDYSKVLAKLNLVELDIKNRTDKLLEYKPTSFHYEDVLVQIHFDGFPDAEHYIALGSFPTRSSIAHIIRWLRMRVLNMGALAAVDSSQLPFSLHRNGLLDPDRLLSSVCSPPTAKFTCRVQLVNAASGLPFQHEVRAANTTIINQFVGKLFPEKKPTPQEIEKRSQEELKKMRDCDHKSYVESFNTNPKFAEAQEANQPVSWRFHKHDGMCDKGEFSCDRLRNFLNQGHFDDPSKFGALLPTYEFSFDGSSWSPFLTHSEFLDRINHEAITRTLNAVTCTVQAMVDAAFFRFEPGPLGVHSQVDIRTQSQTGARGSLSFKLPSLKHLRRMTGEDKVRVFTEAIAEQQNDRKQHHPPLFLGNCVVTHDDEDERVCVEFAFPSFLNLDLIMSREYGLLLALESIIFDFYFQQKLVQPRGGAVARLP